VTVKERLSEPPAGIVSGVFAPDMLNPDVFAVTDVTVQESKMLEFVIDSVIDCVPPVLVVNPDMVFPAIPQALSAEVKLMAVTSTLVDPI
jgi:hypothetical protein